MTEMAKTASEASSTRWRAETEPASTGEALSDGKIAPKKLPGAQNGAGAEAAGKFQARARSNTDPTKLSPKLSKGMMNALAPVATAHAPVEEIKLVTERSGLSPKKLCQPFEEARAEEEAEEQASCEGSEVILHVYDLHRLSKLTRLAIFHVGVEVYQIEFFFSTHGCRWCEPMKAEGHVHKKIVPLGRTKLEFTQIQDLFRTMQKEWPEGSYNLFTKNCQTFAIDLVKRLKVGAGIPSEYVRYARWGTPSQRSGAKREADERSKPKVAQSPRLFQAR